MRAGILKRPLLEVTLLHFGVFPLFAAVLFDKSLMPYFLGLSFGLNYAHRHVTLGFVYGDPEEFARRKALYLALPLVLIAVTALVIYADKFIWLVIPVLAWNLYHVLAQKFGFLRIYRATSRADTPRFAERLFVFGGALPTALVALAFHRRTLRRLDLGALVKLSRAVPRDTWEIAAYTSIGLYALLGLWLVLRWRKSEERNWMYPSYIASIFICYGAVCIDFVAGYAAFGISHFVEYLAFTASYTKRKHDFKSGSFMALMSRQSLVVLAIIPLIIAATLLAWRYTDLRTLTYYVIGSAMLHFLYDGLLWKLRNREVSKVLFAPPSSA